MFRVCANTDLTGKGFAFLCPNGTIFNQRYFVCDWYNNVNCADSVQFYAMNDAKRIESHAEMMRVVKTMLEFTMNKPFISGDPVTGGNNPNAAQKQQQQLVVPEYGRTGALDGAFLNNDFPFENSVNNSPQQDKTSTGVDSSSSASNFGKENLNVATNPQKIYVSSLGELSTDHNSGFDINKSKFLVTDQVDKTVSATTDREVLNQLLENQVNLIAQNLNQNSLTNPVQINNALLTATNQFGLSPTERPRLITSNNIIPLPKGFNLAAQNRFATTPNQPNVVSHQQSIATFTESKFASSNSQFPSPQLSFPGKSGGGESRPFQPVQQLQHPSDSPARITSQQYQNSISQQQQHQSGFPAADVNALQESRAPASNPSSGGGVQLSAGISNNNNNAEASTNSATKSSNNSEKQKFTYPLAKNTVRTLNYAICITMCTYLCAKPQQMRSAGECLDECDFTTRH